MIINLTIHSCVCGNIILALTTLQIMVDTTLPRTSVVFRKNTSNHLFNQLVHALNLNPECWVYVAVQSSWDCLGLSLGESLEWTSQQILYHCQCGRSWDIQWPQKSPADERQPEMVTFLAMCKGIQTPLHDPWQYVVSSTWDHQRDHAWAVFKNQWGQSGSAHKMPSSGLVSCCPSVPLWPDFFACK